MLGGVLQFPGSKKTALLRSPIAPEEPAQFERYDPDRTIALCQLSSSVHDRAKALIDFADRERGLARQAGVESIAIEISAALEGEKFKAVLESLRKAASLGRSAEVSLGGMDKLRRVETLLSEASTSLARVNAGLPPTTTPDYGLGQGASGSMDLSSLWTPFVILGVVAIAGVIISSLITGPKAKSG